MPKKTRKKPRGTHFTVRKRKTVKSKDEGTKQEQTTEGLLPAEGNNFSEPKLSICKPENIFDEREEVAEEFEMVVEETKTFLEEPEPEKIVEEAEMILPDDIRHDDDDITIVKSEIFLEECEPTHIKSDNSSSQGKENPEMQITPLQDVSNDPTFKNEYGPLLPTAVVVIRQDSSDAFLREHSPAQDSHHALWTAYDTSSESDIRGTHPPETSPFTGTTAIAGGSRQPPTPLSPPEGATSHVGDFSQLLVQVKECLLLLLPNLWTPIIFHGGIHVCRLAVRLPTLVQRALFFSSDGTVLASVNGKDLPAAHSFWQYVQKIALDAGSTKEFSEFVCRTVDRFRSYETCKGVEEFREVWQTAEDVEIDHNRFHEHRFGVTCRSAQCFMIVPSLKIKRCNNCATLWRILSKRSARLKDKTPQAKKADKYLNTPQKNKRLALKSKTIRPESRQCKVQEENRKHDKG